MAEHGPTTSGLPVGLVAEFPHGWAGHRPNPSLERQNQGQSTTASTPLFRADIPRAIRDPLGKRLCLDFCHRSVTAEDGIGTLGTPTLMGHQKLRGPNERRFRAAKEGEQKEESVPISRAVETLVPVAATFRPPSRRGGLDEGLIWRHALRSDPVSGQSGPRKSSTASSAPLCQSRRARAPTGNVR